MFRFSLPTESERGQWNPADHKDELTKRLRWASKVSICMDVGGKFFTYIVLSQYDKPDEEHMPSIVSILEYLTTVVEAAVKWQHASHMHAREMEEGSIADTYTLFT